MAVFFACVIPPLYSKRLLFVNPFEGERKPLKPTSAQGLWSCLILQVIH